jgi:hypothetical protein
MARILYVIWHDAHSGSSSWEDLSDLEDDGPYVVHSVGYELCVGEGGKEGHVTIAQSWSEADCVDSVLHIPDQMVVELYELNGLEVLSASQINAILHFLRRAIPRGTDEETQLIGLMQALSEQLADQSHRKNSKASSPKLSKVDKQNAG